MFINLNGQKAQIQYPCRWLYKVITHDLEQARGSLDAMLQDFRSEITISNRSRTGKYTCLNIEVEVENEIQRNTIYQSLKELETVKMVL